MLQVFLETVPFGTAIPGLESSIQGGDCPATEKFKIIVFAWISDCNPFGTWYFKQRLGNRRHLTASPRGGRPELAHGALPLAVEKEDGAN